MCKRRSRSKLAIAQREVAVVEFPTPLLEQLVHTLNNRPNVRGGGGGKV